tara:strand:- start:1884 stop:2672 length:789 start_codon:yes stop_codon:yes gene_type:complete
LKILDKIKSMLYIILIFINLFLILYFKKKEIKSFFFKKKISVKTVDFIHPIFKTESNVLNFPTKNHITNFFVIPSGSNIKGMTSDLEAWILSMMSKISNNIFEFGTCSGKTTYLFALNSPNNARINTITIKNDENLKLYKGESKSAYRNIYSESKYDKFMFTDTEVAKKINVRFINSLKLDETEFINKCDLIFIDGGHTYSIVKNDSEKAFKMVCKKGFIFWHDYVIGKRSAKDVVKYLHEISKHKKLNSIKGTSLVYFKNE